jgi:hypothetical protein
MQVKMPKKFQQSESGDRGWFVGHFDKAVHQTNLLDAGHQFCPAGDYHKPHYHKIATEINLITQGRARINGEIYTAGMGVIFYPGEVAECEYLEDTWTMVIKIPSVPDDKYFYGN